MIAPKLIKLLILKKTNFQPTQNAKKEIKTLDNT